MKLYSERYYEVFLAQQRKNITELRYKFEEELKKKRRNSTCSCNIQKSDLIKKIDYDFGSSYK